MSLMARRPCFAMVPVSLLLAKNVPLGRFLYARTLPGSKPLCKRKKKSQKGFLFLWRRRRDLNPRASFPTYSLSRGAPSPLGYFSMVNVSELIRVAVWWRRGRDSNSWSLAGSLVFKTSSLNHSDTSPNASNILAYPPPCCQCFFKNFSLHR